MKKLIKNGIIISAENEYEADILVDGEKVVAIGTNLETEDAEVIDAKGKYVMPGGVDQHVHFSFEFNGNKVQGFDTSNAAVLGGTTTVIEFVNQIKGKGLVESIEEYRKENAENVAMADYSFHSVMTDPRDEVIEEIPDLVKAGYPTMKLFMAYKGMFFHADDTAILKALKKGKDVGITVMVHAENADAIDVLQKELIDQGKTDPYGHVLSRPPVVEAEATRRAIYLAELAGAPLYIVHVTCKAALDEIARAYDAGQPIKGETCSHYLVLDESNLAKPDFEGAKYVCSPALRTPDQFDELWNGLNNGWLNAISSDHCAFNWKEQKSVGKDDFRNIPNGAPGLENRLTVLWTYGVEEGKISKQKLVELYATNPAKNNGLDHCKGFIEVGYDADIVIYDPEYRGTFSNEKSLHGIDYCTYEGMEQKGQVETVLLRGQVVVKNSEYCGQKGQGQLIFGKPYGSMYR
jgi:dihydropyrimidinase